MNGNRQGIQIRQGIHPGFANLKQQYTDALQKQTGKT